MSCCGTGLANFSCGITSLLPHRPWANSELFSHEAQSMLAKGSSR